MKFVLTREVTGYSRGYQCVEVEADTLEDAMELAEYQAQDIDVDIVRDDRDYGEWWNGN